MKDTIFEKIRRTCADVTKQAEFVDINLSVIEEYAAKLELLSDEETFDENHHYISDEEKTAAYILLLNSINFGSGDFPLLEEEGFRLIDGSAYFTMSTRLKNFFEQEADLSPRRFTSITDEEMAHILEMPYDQPISHELSGRFADAFRDLSRSIIDTYDGKFYNFVAAAKGKAAHLVEMLAAQPRFRDVQSYKGNDVFFLKRAQCAAADIYQGFKHLDGRELFDDIKDLTMLADCDLPHVLRLDDVLYYGPQLIEKVDSGTFISAGSPEEIELRATALHAVELIAAAKGALAIDVDHALWHRKQQDMYTKSDHVPHRTRTNFY